MATLEDVRIVIENTNLSDAAKLKRIREMVNGSRPTRISTAEKRNYVLLEIVVANAERQLASHEISPLYGARTPNTRVILNRLEQRGWIKSNRLFPPGWVPTDAGRAELERVKHLL